LEIVLRIPFLLLGLSFLSTALWADIDAEVGLETRYFFKEGLFEQDKLHPSIKTEITYQNYWGDNSVEVIGFARMISKTQSAHMLTFVRLL